LAARGETETLERAHAAYYLALAERAQSELVGLRQDVWIERLEREHDNIRAALHWARSSSANDVFVRMAGALWRFWGNHGHLNEGWNVLEEAVAYGDGDGVLDQSVARVLLGAGVLASQRGYWERSRALLADGLDLLTRIGDESGVAAAIAHLGINCIEQGEYGRGVALLERALAIRRRLGDRRGEAVTTSHIGGAALVRGDYDAAIARFRACIPILREVGDTTNMAGNLSNPACALVLSGDIAAARPMWRESLDTARIGGFSENLVEGIEIAAAILTDAGQTRLAAHLLGAATAYRGTMSLTRAAFMRIMVERQETALRAALGDEAYEQAWDEGYILSLEQAIAEAIAAIAPS